VYKLTAYPGEGSLADVLRGRTTMEMSREVPRAARIRIDDLEPGDVMFFGRGRHSKPAQVDHTAIYLGNRWLVQSSGYGVALAPFDGCYQSSFAWAITGVALSQTRGPGSPWMCSPASSRSQLSRRPRSRPGRGPVSVTCQLGDGTPDVGSYALGSALTRLTCRNGILTSLAPA